MNPEIAMFRIVLVPDSFRNIFTLYMGVGLDVSHEFRFKLNSQTDSIQYVGAILMVMLPHEMNMIILFTDTSLKAIFFCKGELSK